MRGASAKPIDSLLSRRVASPRGRFGAASASILPKTRRPAGMPDFRPHRRTNRCGGDNNKVRATRSTTLVSGSSGQVKSRALLLVWPAGRPSSLSAAFHAAREFECRRPRRRWRCGASGRPWDERLRSSSPLSAGRAVTSGDSTDRYPDRDGACDGSALGGTNDQGIVPQPPQGWLASTFGGLAPLVGLKTR